MLSKVIQFTALWAPEFLLPRGTKTVVNLQNRQGGVQIPLDIKERRESFERDLKHKKEVILNKYSPVRHLIKFYKEERLKRKQKYFYCLIGKITLTHAGIEQDLKDTLMEDWGVPLEFKYKNKKPKNLDHICGANLRSIFLALLEDLTIPENYLNEYKMLCDKFGLLSKKRNETVKAIYAFNKDTSDISKPDRRKFRGYDKFLSPEDWINSLNPKVDLAVLEGILNDLLVLRGEFLMVKIHVFRDKQSLFLELCSEIGKTYPGYAHTNPYLYKSILENRISGTGNA